MVLLVTVACTMSGCSSRTEADVASAPLRLLIPAPGPLPTLWAAFADAINTSDARFRLVVEPAVGSVVVVSQLQRGEGDVGLAQADVVYQAFRQGTPEDQRPHQRLRGVAVGGLNRLLIYARRDAGLSRIVDLRGKRVGILPPGTAGEVLTRVVLEASGLTFQDFEKRVHSFREMGSFFDPEQLDAMIIVGNVDPNTIIAPVSPAALKLLPVDRDVLDKLRGEYPFIQPVEVLWRNDDSGIQTVQSAGADSLVIARADVPEAAVYWLTASIHGALPSRNPFGVDADTAPATPIPLHPGAARFYRELQLLR